MTTTALAPRSAELMLAGPLGSLDHYIQAANAIPVLSAEEEFELATRLRETNDLDAAKRLVLSHLRFVVHVARGYAGYGLQLGDLIQEGNIGLMKAVRRFDPNVGVRLVSFAVHWIRAEIHEYVLRNWRLVRVATTKAQRKLFFNLRKAKKHLGWLSKDEAEAVAADLGVTTRDVAEMEQRLSGRDVSFDPDPRGRRELRARDVPAQPRTAIRPMRSSGTTPNPTTHDRLADALAKLDERSRVILARRWLADSKATLHELAAEYGVSAERIRQIEANAHRQAQEAASRQPEFALRIANEKGRTVQTVRPSSLPRCGRLSSRSAAPASARRGGSAAALRPCRWSRPADASPMPTVMIRSVRHAASAEIGRDGAGTAIRQLLVVGIATRAVRVARHLDHRLVVLIDYEARQNSRTSKKFAFRSLLFVAKVMLPGMFSVMLSPMRVTLTPVRSSSARSFASWRSM